MTMNHKYVFKCFNYLLLESKKEQQNYLQHTN